MSNPIYNELGVNSFKKILQLVDDEDHTDTAAILIKCGAEWCGPCQRIKPYCHSKFKNLPSKVICFDIDIDKEENMELYLAYKQKKMVRSVPVIFAYISKPNRDSNHWWAPDFSVNSAQQHDLDNFFEKVNTLTK
jgi:thiol-disulfide isomerase/thioredoxin